MKTIFFIYIHILLKMIISIIFELLHNPSFHKTEWSREETKEGLRET